MKKQSNPPPPIGISRPVPSSQNDLGKTKTMDSTRSRAAIHHDYLTTCIELLESKLSEGCYIEFEGVFWVLYDEDGESAASSGTTLNQMITGLGQLD